MDRGSGHNIIYAETLDRMGIDQGWLRPYGSLFHGVVSGTQDTPIGQTDLPITFGTMANIRTETLTFEIVSFLGVYHINFGRPCYARFMVVANYT